MHQNNTDLPAGLSQPALRALAGAGIQRLEQLTEFSEAELKKLHGLGPHGIEKLRGALGEKGWSFAGAEPVAVLDRRFSDENAAPTPWTEARARLARAELYWLTTVRPDGRPHVTPLIAVWLEQALFFCTGADERKAANLRHNPHCIMTTGCNTLGEGLDLVVEGQGIPVRDITLLQRVADAYLEKYGKAWHFTVADGALRGTWGNLADVYRLAPETAFGFGKGSSSSQTRWRF